jgi:hypothetical protein
VIVTRRSWHFKLLRWMSPFAAARAEFGEMSSCAYAGAFLAALVRAVLFLAVGALVLWALVGLPGLYLLHLAGLTLADVKTLEHGRTGLYAEAAGAAFTVAVYAAWLASARLRATALGQALADRFGRACRPVKVEG